MTPHFITLLKRQLLSVLIMGSSNPPKSLKGRDEEKTKRKEGKEKRRLILNHKFS